MSKLLVVTGQSIRNENFKPNNNNNKNKEGLYSVIKFKKCNFSNGKFFDDTQLSTRGIFSIQL